MNRLSKAIDRAIERSRQRTTIFATLGKRLADGTYQFTVDGRPECIWVTMRLSSGAQTTVPAVNSIGIEHSAKLAVEMRKEREDYVIVRRSTAKSLSAPRPTDPSGTPPHIHDHSGLDNLDQDTHPQYFNEARGDARYYPRVETGDEDATPFDNNDRVLAESTATGELIWATWNNVRGAIKTYYDSVVATLTNKTIDASNNTITNINTSSLADDAVSNAKLVNMVQSTIKGRQAGGGTGDPEDLTPTQVMAITKAVQLLSDAGFILVVDGTNGLITRTTPATGGSLRNMLDMRIISTGSVSDGFGPSLFFSMNDAETGGDNFLGSFGYGRDGADNNGKLVIRNYVAGISTVAGEINSALNWGIGPLTSTLARLHIFQNVLGALTMRLQNSSAGDDPTLDTYQNRITTTDATPTTLHTFPIPANNTVYIKAVVIARRTGGAAGTADDGACYLLSRAYTTKGGTVTLLGTLENIQLEDVAAYNCALVISGTNVIVQVTGVANTNITWHLVEGEISPVGS